MFSSLPAHAGIEYFQIFLDSGARPAMTSQALFTDSSNSMEKTSIDQNEPKVLDLKAVIAPQEKRGFPQFASQIDYTVVIVVALLLAAFQIWTAGFGVLFTLKQRIIHIPLLGALIFFLHGLNSRFDTDCQWVEKSIWLGPCLIRFDAGFPETWEIVFGLIVIVVLLEMTRRVVGLLALPIIALCFPLYAFLGPYMPSVIGHPGMTSSALSPRCT